MYVLLTWSVFLFKDFPWMLNTAKSKHRYNINPNVIVFFFIIGRSLNLEMSQICVKC